MKTHHTRSLFPLLAYLGVAAAAAFVALTATAHGNDQQTGTVTRVVADSAAERAGLREGDRLLVLDGRQLATMTDLEHVLKSHAAGDVVTMLVERDGRRLEMSLTFGARPDDGGPSIGIALALGSQPTGQAALDEDLVSTQACRDWLAESYPIATLSQRLDVELPQEPDALWQCVDGDLTRMRNPLPRAWCDNVFKIHCGGLDILTEIGATLADRCEDQARGAAEAPDPLALRCLRDATYQRFVEGRQVTEGTACLELLAHQCAVDGAADGAADSAADSTSASAAASLDVLWRRPLGDGYSGILHDAGRLFTMTREGDAEVAVALDAASGRTLWQTRYEHPEYRQQRGFGVAPRATPSLAGGRLFTAGIVGTLAAFDATDGKLLWRRELWQEEELSGNLLSHGYSSSPLAWHDLVILPVGGPTAGLVAFDQATGGTVWTTPTLRNSFSSPTLVQLAGTEQVLAFMADELVSVDPRDGTILWRYPHTNDHRHNISVPLATGDDRVFLSSLQAGARGLRVTRHDGQWQVVEEWANRRMQLYHVTSVFDGERVYGSSGVASPAFLTAIDAQTGEIAWKVRGFGKANVTAAGDGLVILDEDGKLALATPSADGLDIDVETQLLDGVAWTAPTLVGETLYARNTEEILALDLGPAAIPLAGASPEDPSAA